MISVFSGGDEEDRTLDLTDANRTLSQLSYAPMSSYVNIHQKAEFVKSNINSNEKFCEKCRSNTRSRGDFCLIVISYTPKL